MIITVQKVKISDWISSGKSSSHIMVLAASGFDLGLVFVKICSSLRENERNGLRELVAAPSVYDQVEVLPLHQKKENRSTDTANHTTQNAL